MSVYYKEKPEWLSYSIESMLNQTVKPNEFVLVEDGPLTKKLDQVIDKFVKNNPKLFKIIKIKENGGLGPALKIGIENCKNEFIARMDSDDISVSNRCELQLTRFINDKELDMIGANHIEFIDSVDNPVAYKVLPSSFDDIKKYIKRRNPFSHSVVMYKKSAILEAGNYRNYYGLEDYDMWARMILYKKKCENINAYLSYVRVGKDLYARRGGIKYLKSLLKFKKELYKNGISSAKDYFVGSFAHVVVCLLPGGLRKKIYKKFLRERVDILK